MWLANFLVHMPSKAQSLQPSAYQHFLGRGRARSFVSRPTRLSDWTKQMWQRKFFSVPRKHGFPGWSRVLLVHWSRPYSRYHRLPCPGAMFLTPSAVPLLANNMGCACGVTPGSTPTGYPILVCRRKSTCYSRKSRVGDIGEMLAIRE